jgi:hypothetical protein
LRATLPNLSAYFQRHNAAYQTHQTYFGKSPLILKVHTSVNNFLPPTPIQHLQTEGIHPNHPVIHIFALPTTPVFTIPVFFQSSHLYLPSASFKALQ